MTPPSDLASSAILARGLRKSFGPVHALDGIDLAVPQGSMVLLVGPNGAGKTTLLRLLLDLTPRSGGSLQVMGRDPAREGAEIRAGAGVLSEAGDFPFGFLTVRGFLAMQARFRPTWDEGYARHLAQALDLRMDRKWKALSKGEGRRAQVVAALAHRPPLLLLDEPTDGLDPVAREELLGILASHLADTGATTLYCTHVLHEVQRLPDRLVALRQGRIQVDEAVDVLRATHFRVRLAGAASDDAPLPPGPDAPVTRIREEARSGSLHQWVLRGERDAIISWGAGAGLGIEDMSPVSLADLALAYLSPRSLATPLRGGVAPADPEPASVAPTSHAGDVS